MVGIGIYELLLLVGVSMTPIGLPLGLPPGPEDPFLVQAAPDDGVYYSMWVASREPDAESVNAIDRLLAEPELKAFVAATITELERYARDRVGGDESAADAVQLETAIMLARQLLRGPAMMFVNDFSMDNGVPEVDAGLVLKLADDDDQLIEQIQRTLRLMLPGEPVYEEIAGHRFELLRFPAPAPTVRWGLVDDYLIVAVGDGVVEGILERAETPAPPWYLAAKQESSVNQLASIGFLDLEKLQSIIAIDRAPPALLQLLRQAGLDNLKTVTTVTGLDDQGLLSVSRLSSEGPLHGLVGLVGDKPLTASDLSMIPEDATVAFAASLDMAAFVDQWHQLLVDFDPRAASYLDAGLALAKAEFGVDLREDLLSSLGSSWRLYTSPSHGNWLTGWTVSIAVEDADKLREVNLQLAKLFGQSTSQSNRSAELRRLAFGGKEVFYLILPAQDAPFSPAWCIDDDELVIALFPQSVKTHLAHKVEGRGLERRAEIAAQLEGNSVAMIQYLDLPKIAEYAYPAIQVGLRIMSTELAREGVNLPVHQLPTADALVGHLEPFVGVLIREESALIYRCRSSLPTGGGVLTTAPISAAVVLPAVAAARQAARRMESHNNVRKLLLCMQNFENIFGALPATHFVTPDGKALHSWRVHMLPLMGDDEMELYNRFKMDEAWDSEHNKQLIPLMPDVFRSPHSTLPPGKSNYLAVLLPVQDGKYASAFRPPRIVKDSKESGFFSGHKTAEITDGTAQTIGIVEVSDEAALIWTKPGDITFDEKTGTRSWGVAGHSSFTVGMISGHAIDISRSVKLAVIKSLITRNGGEEISLENQLAP